MKPHLFAPIWTSLVLLCFSVAPLSAKQFGLFTYNVGMSHGTSEYDLKLRSVNAKSDLDDHGESLVIVALVANSLHIRIFDGHGNRVADELETESDKWQTMSGVKEVMIANPMANETDTENAKVDIIEKASLVGLGTAEITGYPKDTVGDVVIPAAIGGVPVTAIGWGAFSDCTGLTSIAIPSSITMIGLGAFYGCSGLTSITIPGSTTHIGAAFSGCSALNSISVEPLNENYRSFEGVLYDRSLTTLIRCPQGKVGQYSIPEGVVRVIGYASNCVEELNVGAIECFDPVPGAFSGCRQLRHIVFPETFIHMGRAAFEGCSNLTKASFLGNAPIITPEKFGWVSRWSWPSVFNEAAPEFTIYYLSGSEGFTSPTWNGYPTVMIDEATYPAASWLLQHDLPYDTDLNSNDSLLVAYALDLDPNVHMTPSLPKPAIDPATGTLSLTFHATSPGITYTVETSTDLKNWTADGVTLSDPGPDNTMTASVSRDAPNQFMRLVVEN